MRPDDALCVCLVTEAASAQHTEVFVTAFHCCVGMFSFYSPAGDVVGAPGAQTFTDPVRFPPSPSAPSFVVHPYSPSY